VAVKIKLKRLGKIREPYYRIVVADARTKRDGRAIEEIGKYHPKAEPSLIEVNSERVQHWLSVGAQPTDPVRVLLKITGDWQKFNGEPGSEGTLKTATPKADKKEAFDVAAKASQASKEAKEEKGARGSRAAKSTKDTAPKETVTKDAAPKDAAPKETATKDAAPKETATKDAAPKDAPAKESTAKEPAGEADAKAADAKAADTTAEAAESGSGA
jgi:small subunit ribosomal protein S16